MIAPCQSGCTAVHNGPVVPAYKALRKQPCARVHGKRQGASCPRAPCPRSALAARPQVGPCRWGTAQATTRVWRPTAPAWQDPRAPWYAFARRARRDTAGPHGGRRAAGLGGGKPLASTHTPCTRWNGRAMKGTRFAQCSTEVLRRGAAAVLPQHLPDRWLDALLEEADLLASEADDMGNDCCADLLGAVLVLVSAQRGDPPELEVVGTTLHEYLHCYIIALAAESVSRRTDIWVEPPTLANIFDAAREVRARRRGPAGPSPRPCLPPED